MSNLEDALKKLSSDLNEGKVGGGLPLCRYCGASHEPSDVCPPRRCVICGATHPHNRTSYPHLYEFCERNERFFAYLKAHEEWVKENTAKIWAQPDKEKEEES